MGIFEILILILSVVIIILGYIIYNLYKKLSYCEDILSSYLNYLQQISAVIEASDDRINKLDRNQMFSSDDEIGFFFKNVKKIQEVLNQFDIKKL